LIMRWLTAHDEGGIRICDTHRRSRIIPAGRLRVLPAAGRMADPF
jgi:hypothetical protein